MASVYKKPGSPRYTMSWTGPDGRRHRRAGTTDRAHSLRLARRLEDDALEVRLGLKDPAEAARRTAAAQHISTHLADYRASLLAKGDGAHHARNIHSALTKLFRDAGIATLAELAPDKVQAALGRLKAERSARTVNHALGAAKSFAKWLYHVGRLKEVPPGLMAIKAYNEKLDRRRIRRALSSAELATLLHTTERGPHLIAKRAGRGGKVLEMLTGPERAMLYATAMGSGLRANELRTLTPAQFHLDGDDPHIVVLACYSKHRREDRQQISRDLADTLATFLAGRPADRPWMCVPLRTGQILRDDLERAGIPWKTKDGVCDFHALRVSFITNLIESGVDPKTTQELARHSTIQLTIDRYTKTTGERKRKALEGGE